MAVGCGEPVPQLVDRTYDWTARDDGEVAGDNFGSSTAVSASTAPQRQSVMVEYFSQFKVLMLTNGVISGSIEVECRTAANTIQFTVLAAKLIPSHLR